MLSISRPMSVGRATQYFKADDYYLSEKGEWQGRGAAALGLSGEVTQKDFRAVLRGTDPTGGEPLVEKKGRGKGGEEVRRGGVDLTFSAPKSVTLLALADPRVKEAHEGAVTALVGYLEREYSHTREQRDGVRSVELHANLTVAKFTHMVARASAHTDGSHVLPDPQLHTHAFVVNLIQTGDAEWKAHHNDALYRDQLQLGRFYRAELVGNLEKLGYAVEVTNDRQFLWEVRGVPEPVREAFSKRREAILARAEELREAGEFPKAGDAALREIATKATRLPKGKIPREVLLEHWKETLRERGTTLEALHAAAVREGRDRVPEPPDGGPEDAVRTAAEVKTATESVFTRGDALDLAVRLTRGEFGFQALDGAFGDLACRGELPHLGTTLEAGKSGRLVPRHAFTTNEMQAMEREILAAVLASKGGYAPVARPTEVAAFIAEGEAETGRTYTRGQAAVAELALTSPDRVNIVQGDAGAGKTASLALVREFAENRGIRVVGLGFTGKAAQELQDGAGIPSRTLDGFLHSRAGEDLPAGSLLVLDEASMAGSRHFRALLGLAEERDLKVVVVGDRKQFQSIAAGRNHAVLQDQTDVGQVHMREVLRQKTPQARAVVHAIARGKTDRALQVLAREGGFRQISRREERLDAVVGEYLRLREEKGHVLVLSATNADRVELNERIRRTLVERGELAEGRPFRVQEPTGIGAEEAIQAKSYRVGDKILVLADLSPELKGGTEADVVGVDARRNTLIVQGPEGEERIRLRDHYRQLAVYAVTERPFTPGDRVVFLRNDTQLGVENGLQGTVRRLDGRGNIGVETERGKEIRFRLADPEGREGADARYRYNFLTHAYAVTEYKSQGATTPAVVWYADTKRGRVNRNSFFVAATRARETVRVFTDDREALKQLVRAPQSKSSTLDYARTHRARSHAYWRDRVDLDPDRAGRPRSAPAGTGKPRFRARTGEGEGTPSRGEPGGGAGEPGRGQTAGPGTRTIDQIIHGLALRKTRADAKAKPNAGLTRRRNAATFRIEGSLSLRSIPFLDLPLPSAGGGWGEGEESPERASRDSATVQIERTWTIRSAVASWRETSGISSCGDPERDHPGAGDAAQNREKGRKTMGTRKDLATLERQAAEAERRAKKLRGELTRQKRETRDREDRNAGAALRALWARWAEVNLDDIEAALAPAFGAPPSGQRQGVEAAGPLFEQGRGGDRESPGGPSE